MSIDVAITNQVVLIPLALSITYYDVRYRRIPNAIVLVTLLGGLLVNAALGGWRGAASSVAGCVLAFGLMLILHLVGHMGAGDVKLFAAIGALIGVKLVLPAFLTILLFGGALALAFTLYSGTVLATMIRVGYIFADIWAAIWSGGSFDRAVRRGPLQYGHRRQTIPYGVAITYGSLLSVFIALARA